MRMPVLQSLLGRSTSVLILSECLSSTPDAHATEKVQWKTVVGIVLGLNCFFSVLFYYRFWEQEGRGLHWFFHILSTSCDCRDNNSHHNQTLPEQSLNRLSTFLRLSRGTETDISQPSATQTGCGSAPQSVGTRAESQIPLTPAPSYNENLPRYSVADPYPRVPPNPEEGA
ncbi:hypothetical protein SERLADRAFT_438848 [Serpula lacrymans var. lacrymans S7.9]|uniref:Uncharacterized protein n=1 Tax=Serpula lacrymans var. lacrymans (strain S7.9) TaxID=578457 RepID=F8P0I0_SERL9|nr:uncharacterized protein SERLADRAFT_438848 [Serpula lacrymans var. lacrymans S7.9]EGO23535.1 hypothetical protein SERLADRAFT_438848 [Serpula lacrymans var. lacrymans S7.9]